MLNEGSVLTHWPFFVGPASALSAIILAIISFLSGLGWILDRKKHRQEVESLRADNRQKDMNLSKDYVTEWRTYIAEPLQREVGELRAEVAQLRHAIQRIADCDYRAECPVLRKLQHSAKSEV